MSSSEAGADVAAVIVTHNSASLLPACVGSLSAQRGDIDLHVLVSDSGSGDDVAARCAEFDLHFLPGPNAGFGAAVNRALAHPSVAGARYVLVLNPDVQLRGTLADFVALCDDRPGCGVFGPRQIDQHGDLVCTMGVGPTPADYWRGARSMWPDWDWDTRRYARERCCDWLLGSFLLIRRQTLSVVGGFDERFFLCSEEVDLCRRVREAGQAVAYLPQLTVMHAAADRRLDEHRERLMIWSKLLYIRKWYGPWGRLSMRTALVVIFARRYLHARRSGQPGHPHWVHLIAALKFRPARYGPAPLRVGHAVAKAAGQPAAGQREQLDPAATTGAGAGHPREAVQQVAP